MRDFRWRRFLSKAMLQMLGKAKASFAVVSSGS
jgi:hypothetical protein